MICLIFFRNHRFLRGVWLISRTRIADTDIPDMVTKFSQFSRSDPSTKITFAKFNFTVYQCQTILPINKTNKVEFSNCLAISTLGSIGVHS